MSNLDYIKDGFVSGIIKSRDSGGLRDPRSPAKLWARDLGTHCFRKLWYETNMPEKALPVDIHTASKFILGDTVEILVKSIFEHGGIKVHSEQERVEINRSTYTVSGRIDFMIDDVVVEVKSINDWGFSRIMKRGSYVDKSYIQELNDEFDPHGYLHQLSFYMLAKNAQYGLLLLYNKSTGDAWFEEVTSVPSKNKKMVLSYSETYLRDRMDKCYLVARKQSPDDLARLPTTTIGSNEALKAPCIYCQFKFKCWPGLRSFDYANREVYLTKVNKVPTVEETTWQYASYT
jgi:hypothetical protein